MNFFRVHRLPLFQAPDTPAAAAPADPAVIAAADPAAGDPPAADPSPAAADPADPAAAAADPATDPAKPHGNKGAKPWFLARISEESERARIAEERAQAAEELAQRLQRNPADPAAPPAPARTDADVEARAQQIVAQRQIGNVISEGVATFEDWDDRAAILGSAGAASPEFVMDVIGVDHKNAHKILHQLADNPAEAARIAKMDTRNRIAALVRISMTASGSTEQPAPPKPAVPPKTISRAPPPPPAIDPGSAQAVDWRSDKVSDADFSKGWEENAAKRAAKRR